MDRRSKQRRSLKPILMSISSDTGASIRMLKKDAKAALACYRERNSILSRVLELLGVSA
jgi:hypothetical protein